MTTTSKRIWTTGLLHAVVLCVPTLAQVQLEGIVVSEPILQPPAEELPPVAEATVGGFGADVEDSSAAAPELVTERYDNRKVKTEREVIQDADQNYINHGRWKTYDPSGRVVIDGHYKHNEMHGVWTRLYYTRENELLNKAPFNQGQLPLVSQANFKDGKLHGKWVIYDARKRRLCEWEFAHGKRDGQSAWWFVTGAKMREISYQAGTINGELNEWDRTRRQVTKDVYVNGSRLAQKTESYPNRGKQAEGTVLYPALVLDAPDDWFACTLATYTQEGDPVKHGKWTSWFPNGQKKLEGEYKKDRPAGTFTWWHENGQKSLVATYKNGKKHGVWTWWHPNGLKSIQGEYANDTPVSEWLWWKDTGRVAQRADFDDPNQRQILAMPSQDRGSLSAPSASKIRQTIFK